LLILAPKLATSLESVFTYFPLHNADGAKVNEVALYCRCAPTVKGGIRFSYKVNGETIALPNVFLKLVDLGV
jgi:hypothetical protein